MVAKKTAVQQPAPSGGPGPARDGGAGASDGPAGAAPARTTARRQPAGRTAAGRRAAGAEPAKKAPAGKTSAGRRAAEAVAGDVGGSDGGRAGKKVAGGRGAGAAGAGGPERDVAGHSTADDAGAVDAAAQTGATTVSAKKTPGTVTAEKNAVPKARIGAAEPGDLAVRPGEEPWTPEEVEGARTELTSEALRLREEIASSEQSLAGLMRDSGDGAGDDQADTGTKNITREHELALAANAREMLTQFEHALQRLDAGTYGLCENCGDPIGKARMQAFPRATLCVECKQKQERRY
ncbi:TraR/DksA C4-type zinc finger protein [Streptomyces sp. NPDC126497]|uniref:TraR/DksA C4-type zinc finger protein n=1 Tax=Streptomyces sp. NPDC126497 TaxID=3155313 RepID=UPI003320756A